MDTAIATDPPVVSLVRWEVLRVEAEGLMRIHASDFKIPSLEAYLGDETEILKCQEDKRLICVMVKISLMAKGYMVWMLGPHPGLANSLMSRLGPWYIVPELRKTGVARQMFELAKLQSRALGAKWLLTTLPVRASEARPHRWLGIPLEKTWLLEI